MTTTSENPARAGIADTRGRQAAATAANTQSSLTQTAQDTLTQATLTEDNAEQPNSERTSTAQVTAESTGNTAAEAAVGGRSTGAGRPQPNKQTADYFALARRVEEAGLMERSAKAYIPRFIVLGLGFAVAGTLLATLGQSLWQLAVAAFFGILFTQTAFLSHDGAHQQIFANGKRNEWFSRIVGNLIVGLSYGWWTKKHGKHHAHPNVVGKDGDIAPGALVFTAEDAAERTGFKGWLASRQGWLFFPLLTLFAFALHYNAVATVLGSNHVKRRGTEMAFLMVRLIGFPALLVMVLGPWLAAAFLAVQLVVFGVYMGGSFAPNHKGMPVIPKDAKVDFMRRQVLTSRNIRGGRVMGWVMGGLNFQIEHHLFSRMPSPQLPKVRPIVREFCAEEGIPYTETGLVNSYVIVVRYLHRVGLGYADPMDCPLIAQYRPR